MKRNTIIGVIPALLLLAFSCASERTANEQLTIPVHTDYRTYSQALSCAEELLAVFESKFATKGNVSRRIEFGTCITRKTTKSVDGKRDSLAYVFNFENNEGFAIIAANKSIPPMLAITEKGHYEPGVKTGVDNFDFYMENLLDTLSVLGFSKNRERGRFIDHYYTDETLGSELGPLMTSQWGQQNCYGEFCPNGISGCVATAIAQVMNYHQHPSSFTTTVEMGNADFTYPSGSPIQLNWNGIGAHTKTHTAFQTCSMYHNTISALMREIGNRVNMVYNSSGSGAPPTSIPSGLSSFGYSCNSPATAVSYHVRQSIENYGPVIMGGQSLEGGHAWVADGYKDLEYHTCLYVYDYDLNEYVMEEESVERVESIHLNWGWDGVCNGYYAYGVYNVSAADSYDDEYLSLSYDFSIGTKMFCDIYPINSF